MATVSGRSRSYAHCGCYKHGGPCCYGRGTRHCNIDSGKNLPPFFGLFPAFGWTAVSTADYSEDSKTDELIKISTFFRFSPSTWTHFLSKPRNKPSLGHIYVVSFNTRYIAERCTRITAPREPPNPCGSAKKKLQKKPSGSPKRGIVRSAKTEYVSL